MPPSERRSATPTEEAQVATGTDPPPPTLTFCSRQLPSSQSGGGGSGWKNLAIALAVAHVAVVAWVFVAGQNSDPVATFTPVSVVTIIETSTPTRYARSNCNSYADSHACPNCNAYPNEHTHCPNCNAYPNEHTDLRRHHSQRTRRQRLYATETPIDDAERETPTPSATPTPVPSVDAYSCAHRDTDDDADTNCKCNTKARSLLNTNCCAHLHCQHQPVLPQILQHRLTLRRSLQLRTSKLRLSPQLELSREWRLGKIGTRLLHTVTQLTEL